MKKFIFIILTFASLNAIELDWIHDYSQALKEAQETNKDIYVFIGADQCRFCDMFKSTALADKRVGQRLKETYILVYLSRDRHVIPKGLETQGVPQNYFQNKQGKEYFHTWGHYNAKGFHLILDEASLYKED